MHDIDYSVLCHYPSLVSTDCITIAVLFFDRNTKECILKSTTNWSRVQSFNDELDIQLVKLQLEGINEEINEIAKSPNFSLPDYTKFYVNSLKFSKIISTKTKLTLLEFSNECCRQYLRFDYDKSKRPTYNEQLKFIKNYLKDSDTVHSMKPIHGFFNELIHFDFVIKDYAFKFFRFENKKETRMIPNIKDWAYDAIKLKDKYRIVFITDIDINDKDKYKTAYNILKEDSYKIITFDNALPFIQSLYSAT